MCVFPSFEYDIPTFRVLPSFTQFGGFCPTRFKLRGLNWGQVKPANPDTYGTRNASGSKEEKSMKIQKEYLSNKERWWK